MENFKCHGWMALILGLLILVNANWSLVSWAIFVGGIIAIKGIIMLVYPCAKSCPAPAKKRKR